MSKILNRENGKRYFAVMDKLMKLVAEGKLTAAEIGVATVIVERWRKEFCPEVFTMGVTEISKMACVGWHVTVSKYLEKFADLGFLTVSKTVAKRPLKLSFESLLSNNRIVAELQSKNSRSLLSNNRIVAELQSTTIYNNTNTNIYIYNLEKFEKLFSEMAPTVSGILTEEPTEDELENLYRYSKGDLKDAMKALECNPDYVKDKRNQYRWIKNKLDHMERRPMCV